MNGIMVVQEARADGKSRTFQEALAAGRILTGLTGLPLEAAAIGDPNRDVFLEFSGPPPTTSHAIQHPLLETYTSDGYVLAFEQLIRSRQPAFIVFPHSYQVRDFVPRLATRYGQVLISDVVAIAEGPLFTRQLMQGRLNASYRHTSEGPCFISVQAGAFPAETAPVEHVKGTGFSVKGTGFSPYSNNPNTEQGALAPEGNSPASISTFTPTLDSSQIRTRPGQPFRSAAQTVDLASAQRIVSVGRGIKAQENIPIVQELATALGAELACSRPICDAGWLPMERQVGSSGQTVAPKLYLAAGISGAIQHLVGIKASQTIVAINKAPDAPIFEVADYGIVGDLLEVIPALTEAVKAMKQ